jgi:hypothetical protein
VRLGAEWEEEKGRRGEEFVECGLLFYREDGVAAEGLGVALLLQESTFHQHPRITQHHFRNHIVAIQEAMAEDDASTASKKRSRAETEDLNGV